MNKSNKAGSGFPRGCLSLVAVAGVALIGGVIYVNAQLPEASQQLPAGAAPLVVTLTDPLNGALVPPNEPTSISAEALAPQPITALELWIDGAPAQTKNAPAGLKQFAATWTWVPSSEGVHVLVARAIDDEQNVGESNVVQVTASKDAATTATGNYKSKPDDTIQSIAKKWKSDPQKIIDLNPQINPKDPLPAGQDVSVPMPTSPEPAPGVEIPPPVEQPTQPPPSPDSAPPPPPGSPNKTIFWLKGLANLFSKNKPPAKPDLTATISGCSAKLVVTDNSWNEDGFRIFRLKSVQSGNGFAEVAVLDANNAGKQFGFTDPDLTAGKYIYYVASFNPAGSTPSNMVMVLVADSKCSTPDKFHVLIENSKLILPQPLEKIYCYLSVNGGMWQRIPPNGYLSPDKGGGFDVSAFLKSLPINPAKGQITLQLECWGWQNNALVFLGKATETLGSNQVYMKGDKFVFSGNLKTPPKWDIGGGGGANIAPPYNLKNTGDPKTCSDHTPFPLLFGVACASAIGDGYAALVWEAGSCWPNDPTCVWEVDGYRVYKNAYPSPVLVKQVAGAKMKMALFPWPPNTFPTYLPPDATPEEKAKHAADYPPCYTVRAYRDDMGESADSKKYCFGAPDPTGGITTLDIPASFVLTRYVWKEECGLSTSLSDMHGKGSSVGPQEIEVGFYYTTSGCDFAWVARGAVWFDVSKISPNASIMNATLQYTVKKTNYYSDLGFPAEKSCANRLMLGTKGWMGVDFGDQKYWIPGEAYNDLPLKPPSKDITVNVTSAVKEWLQGTRPNNGFVFRQTTEGMHTDWDWQCTSIYNNFVLKVTGFFKP